MAGYGVARTGYAFPESPGDNYRVPSAFGVTCFCGTNMGPGRLCRRSRPGPSFKTPNGGVIFRFASYPVRVNAVDPFGGLPSAALGRIL